MSQTLLLRGSKARLRADTNEDGRGGLGEDAELKILILLVPPNYNANPNPNLFYESKHFTTFTKQKPDTLFCIPILCFMSGKGTKTKRARILLIAVRGVGRLGNTESVYYRICNLELKSTTRRQIRSVLLPGPASTLYIYIIISLPHSSFVPLWLRIFFYLTT